MLIVFYFQFQSVDILHLDNLSKCIHYFGWIISIFLKSVYYTEESSRVWPTDPAFICSSNSSNGRSELELASRPATSINFAGSGWIARLDMKFSIASSLSLT